MHAETRELAMDKMKRAIDDYEISGVETTLSFGKFVMGHPAFRSGNFNTRFIENYFKPEMLKGEMTEIEEMLASVLAVSISKKIKPHPSANTASFNDISKWRKNRV